MKEVSNGNYSLKTGSVKFTFFPESIEATAVRINAVNPVPDKQSYQLNADTLRVRIRSIWPILFKKSLDITEISLVNPSVEIRGKNPGSTPSISDFSLHDNLLTIHDEVNKMIGVLQMDNFRIDNLALKIFKDSTQFFYINRVFLHINNLYTNVAHNREKGKYELQGDIRLWMDQPLIVYPDSNLSVSLDHFDWRSDARNLNIQNIGFSWRQQKEELDSIHIQLHEVVFSQLEWYNWINTGKMMFDSISASKGECYIRKLNPPARKTDTAGTRKSIFSLVSPLTVKHFAVREIYSELELKAGKLTPISSLTGDSLKIKMLHVDIAKKQPVSFDSLDLSVREFRSEDRNQQWKTSFASFRIKKNTVLLDNYSLQSKNSDASPNDDIFRVSTLEMRGLSLPDLSAGKLAVSELSLDRPYVQVSMAGKSSRKNNRAYQPFHESFPFLNIRSLILNNGTYIVRNRKTGKIICAASGIHGHIYANRVLEARSLQELPAACDHLSIDTLLLNLKKARLQVVRLHVDPQQDSIGLDEARIVMNDRSGTYSFHKISAILDSVNTLIQDKQALYLKTVHVDSGALAIRFKAKKDSAAAAVFPLQVEELRIGHLSFYGKGNNRELQTKLDNITAARLRKGDRGLHWEQLSSDFSRTRVVMPDWQLTAASVHLDNTGRSTLNQVQFSLSKKGQHITATVPYIRFWWPVRNTELNSLHIPELHVQGPQLSFEETPEKELADAAETKPARKPFELAIDTLDITDPGLDLHSARSKHQVELITRVHVLRTLGLQLRQKPDSAMQVEADEFLFASGPTHFKKDTGLTVNYAGVDLALGRIRKSGKEEPLSFLIRRLKVDSVSLAQHKNEKGINLDAAQIRITKPTSILINKDSLRKLVYQIPSLVTRETTVRLDRPKQSIFFQRVDLDLPGRQFSLDSFSVQNKLSRDSFWLSEPFEKDYITFHTGPVRASGLDLLTNGKDTGFAIGTLDVQRFFIKPERDKRRPEDTVRFRPLLTGMLQKIPISFSVDTLFLQDALVWHNIIAKKSGQEGSIYFTDINGWVGNIRNFRIHDTDSLRIRVVSKIMGTGNLSMRFRESYTDSLQGFLLSARMGAFEMPELTRILLPLTTVQITAGHIDTLLLNARANDLIAFGDMKIVYHKLHVEKMDESDKKQGFITWLANIVVRRSNHKRGLIYYERLQNKSIFNYWGKIALSGFMTNIRLASNRKYRKEYREATKKYGLPSHLLDND